MSNRKLCVICAETLTPQQAKVGLVCGKALCAWKFNAVPASRRCTVCGRELTESQLALRTCDSFACKATQHVAPAREFKRTRQQQLEAEAVRARTMRAAEAGISNPDDFPFVEVPHNRDKPIKLPETRKQKFREYLLEVIALVSEHQQAVANGTETPRPPLSPIPTLPDEMSRMLTQMCIACRGFCCRQGEERAFITPHTLLAYSRAHPDKSPQQIIEAYMARLPDYSMAGGCVFQGQNGCVMPREMRADECNRFYCHHLKDYNHEHADDESLRAFIVPIQDLRFRSIVYASSEMVQIVRHRSTTMDK